MNNTVALPDHDRSHRVDPFHSNTCIMHERRWSGKRTHNFNHDICYWNCNLVSSHIWMQVSLFINNNVFAQAYPRSKQGPPPPYLDPVCPESCRGTYFVLSLYPLIIFASEGRLSPCLSLGTPMVFVLWKRNFKT